MDVTLSGRMGGPETGVPFMAAVVMDRRRLKAALAPLQLAGLAALDITRHVGGSISDHIAQAPRARHRWTWPRCARPSVPRYDARAVARTGALRGSPALRYSAQIRLLRLIIPMRLPAPCLRRFRPAVLALAVLSIAMLDVHAAQRTVYKGTLQGAGEVVLELDDTAGADGVVSGRYFYPRSGVDIPLRGTGDLLYEPKPRPARPPASDQATIDAADRAASWQGARDAKGYRGQWTDTRTGKQRRFDLQRVAAYDTDQLERDRAQARAAQTDLGDIDLKAGIDATRAPYETLKLAGHAKPVGKDVGAGAVAYHMWVDPRTRFAYPRLSRHPDAQVMRRVNDLLEQRHWRKSLGALECMASAYTSANPGAGTLGGFDEEDINVTWLSRALMTVTEAGSLDCGGAHPFNHFEPYTFDLLRGEYLDWNRVFDAYAPGKQTFGREPSAALSRLVEQVVKAGPSGSQAEQHPSLDDCADLWPQYLALGATSPGALSLSVSGVGHASGACLGTHGRVPFQALRPYLKPGGQAYLAID